MRPSGPLTRSPSHPELERPGLALEGLPPAQRVALGAAGLRTFFRIADAWGLSGADQGVLLGDVAPATLHAWRQEAPATAESYPTDRLTRLSYLLGIYSLLQQLYKSAPAFADAWVAAPNMSAAFGGQAPLTVMRDRGVPGLHTVRRCLEALTGGGFAPGEG